MEVIYIWSEGLLGDFKAALFGSILPGNPYWNGCRWIDVYRISVIDHRRDNSTCNISFIEQIRKNGFMGY